MLQRKFKKFPGLGSSLAFNSDEDNREIEILHEIYDVRSRHSSREEGEGEGKGVAE